MTISMFLREINSNEIYQSIQRNVVIFGKENNSIIVEEFYRTRRKRYSSKYKLLSKQPSRIKPLTRRNYFETLIQCKNKCDSLV